MAKITENGITIERLDTLVERLENGFRTIYGQNINLAPDTPDGQMIGILAQMRMDIEELAEMIYKQLDPDVASGAWLDQRVAYAGLIRRTASYSYLRSVILTGDPYTTLYAGLVVSDPQKGRWVLVQDTQLNQEGSARADFRSELLGAFSVAQSETLTIETVTLGLATATTSETSQLGTEEETDAELRHRFFLSRAKNAINSVLAIEAKISELNDVKQVVVLENNTASIDKKGVNPHSINVIVDGGLDRDIAKVIYHNKGAGVGLQGNTAVEFERQTVYFDRAVPVDIEIAITAVRYEDFTEIDKEGIKKVLSALTFAIGQSISLSRLYSPINTIGGFWVKSLKIARKGQTKQAENIPIQPREIARILSSDITIEVE
ncbi:baseplate J/gp47 family protein [Avibacterium paragallinarum]|uniref:baseplate J/gp47 family protein n=1 Tax=Avibacterium paragallinarum TaxID=728 RepID=UPI0021F6F735|nr:baseplate J/gp47 family protein [Avibacterium paragallinarum]UXN37579.1 baseplate J/gp47 family protein [Avibacterium paragallinarum]